MEYEPAISQKSQFFPFMIALDNYFLVDWRVSKHLQKGLSLPFLFFDHRARL